MSATRVISAFLGCGCGQEVCRHPGAVGVLLVAVEGSDRREIWKRSDVESAVIPADTRQELLAILEKGEASAQRVNRALGVRTS